MGGKRMWGRGILAGIHVERRVGRAYLGEPEIRRSERRHGFARKSAATSHGSVAPVPFVAVTVFYRMKETDHGPLHVSRITTRPPWTVRRGRPLDPATRRPARLPQVAGDDLRRLGHGAHRRRAGGGGRAAQGAARRLRQGTVVAGHLRLESVQRGLALVKLRQPGDAGLLHARADPQNVAAV